MQQNNRTTGGITFSGLLLIAFIVLKLTGVIKWSWLWVLSPIWISIALYIILFAVVIIVGKRRMKGTFYEI